MIDENTVPVSGYLSALKKIAENRIIIVNAGEGYTLNFTVYKADK